MRERERERERGVARARESKGASVGGLGVWGGAGQEGGGRV